MKKYHLDPELIPFSQFLKQTQPDSQYHDEFRNVSMRLVVDEEPLNPLETMHECVMIKRTYGMTLDTVVNYDRVHVDERLIRGDAHHRIHDALFGPFMLHLSTALRAVKDGDKRKALEVLSALLKAVEEL